MKKFFFLFLLLAAVSLIIVINFYNSKESKIQETKFSNIKTEKKLFNEKSFFDNEVSTFTQKQPISFALEIKGDNEFKTKVKNAIRLLWLNDRDGSFSLLRRYIFEIRQSKRTTFIFDEDKPVIELSNEMVENNSLTFLASVIAHNSWHGWYLTENKRKKRKENVPHPKEDKIEKNFIPPFGNEFKKYEDLFSIEEEAFKYQLLILQKLNAPQSEINLIRKRDKKDFSYAHDGNFIIEF